MIVSFNDVYQDLSLSGQCKAEAMVSGVYSLPDKGNALTASSHRDEAHTAISSRLYPGNTGTHL